MIQIAYLSSTLGLLTPADIADILNASREKNGQRGITGMLLYKGGNVIQVLEGEEAQVLPLFATIQKDPRHKGVMKLYQKNVAARDFPEWTMGFHDLSAMDARQLEGFSKILDADFDMQTIQPSTAAKLLNSFKTGVR